MSIARPGRIIAPQVLVALLSLAGGALAQQAPDPRQADQPAQQGIVHKVQAANDHIEMTVNSSRILTMDRKIPRFQINNPDLLDATPLAENQVQIYAKKAGVTQVNLTDSNKQIHTVDVVVTGDVRQLGMLLRSQFPTSGIKVIPAGNSVIVYGYVDRPDHVSAIIRMAEDFYPKVINNITVGGAQQVLLHVKVMEVNRTKLRDVGFDFANISSDGSFAISNVSGLLRAGGAPATVAKTGAETFAFGIVDPGNSFFGILIALQHNSVAKLLAEPTLVTVSGRPAYFNSGGEIPVPIPQSLGTVTIEYRKFGTQIDFVPLVLGNGNIRLEVRPRVSEIDNSIGTTLNGTVIPGFRVREVDTGVELKVGQTLALAGLVQNKVATEKRGIPWLMDVPYVGAPFRRVSNLNNEIELLIMVRPELVEALDCEEVPPYGPGDSSRIPNDWELYMRAYTEVPANYVPAHAAKHAAQSGNLQGDDCQVQPFQGEVLQPGPMAPRDQTLPAPQSGQPAPAGSPSASRSQQGARVARSTAPATGRTSGQARTNPYSRSTQPSGSTKSGPNADSSEPGFLGPTGYDVVK